MLESLGQYIAAAYPNRPSSDLVRDLILGDRSPDDVAHKLVDDYWTRQNTSNRKACPLRLDELYVPVFRRQFRRDVDYIVSNLSNSVDKFLENGRFQADNFYENSSETSEIYKQLQASIAKAPTGVFRDLYAATKGYYNPLCRACLYSPKTRTFWYALRPITLNHYRGTEGEVETTHTFRDIWISWDYNKFTKCIGTYSDTAINIHRLGNLEDESAANGYIHPHVGESGNLCFGRASQVYNDAANTFNLGGGLDIVIGVLNNYEDSDTYAALKRFTMTRDMWRREHGGDDEDTCYCYDCGDEVDTEEDVLSDGDWYHESCCEYSELEDRYIPMSEAAWADGEDTFIRTDDAVTLHLDSLIGGTTYFIGNDDIRRLWIPERLEDVRSREDEIVYGSGSMPIRATLTLLEAYSAPSSDEHPHNNEYPPTFFAGNIALIHEDDIAEEDENGESVYVRLSDVVYRELCSASTKSIYRMRPYPIDYYAVWGRRKDCVRLSLSNDPGIEHYVLKLHLEERDLASQAIAALNLEILQQTPALLTNNMKENEETTC
jgi:hypothetical protein